MFVCLSVRSSVHKMCSHQIDVCLSRLFVGRGTQNLFASGLYVHLFVCSSVVVHKICSHQIYMFIRPCFRRSRYTKCVRIRSSITSDCRSKYMSVRSAVALHKVCLHQIAAGSMCNLSPVVTNPPLTFYQEFRAVFNIFKHFAILHYIHT